MGTRGYFPGGKAAVAWSCHLPTSSAEVKEMSEAIHPLPQYAFKVWYLVKHRDFTFYIEWNTNDVSIGKADATVMKDP